MQKLQYRSMRGRRIQEFLKQVQSQKFPGAEKSEVTRPEQEYQDAEANPTDGQPLSHFASSVPLNQAFHSQSTIRN